MKPQSRLIIDLSVIRRNYETMQSYVGAACAVAGVVKADAYGLGVARIIPAFEDAGCPFYFVATPREGIEVRLMTDKPIAALNPILDEDIAADMATHHIMPVLNTIEDLHIWAAFARRTGQKQPAVLQMDTGMRRVGLGPEDIKYLQARPDILDDIDVQVIMSHFASADDVDSDFNTRQNGLFQDMMNALPPHITRRAKKCLCNSAGTALNKQYHYDMVRPGKSVFGLQAIAGLAGAPRFHSPITMEAKILQILDLKQGDPVGYNETWTADRDMRIATVSMGYADGVRRHLSNIGHLMFQGQKCPIVGRVSMDMTMIRIDHLEGQTQTMPQRGDWVQYLCAEQTPDDIAALIGTNGYEILTGLGKRAERLYKKSSNKIVETILPLAEDDIHPLTGTA